ncbi:MAG: RNA pseudouridine synthase, partial [Gammaproteobacteria bacterium]|nr:RNA pseudouridine synthase [Gammaproteobacteria bacterium]
TGRSHQLRVHAAEIGHPILGCRLYAHPKALAMSQRLMLHASKLEFDHPLSNERVKGFCEVPF